MFTDQEMKAFPQPYATALFSFLYHLASYENGKLWEIYLPSWNSQCGVLYVECKYSYYSVTSLYKLSLKVCRNIAFMCTGWLDSRSLWKGRMQNKKHLFTEMIFLFRESCHSNVTTVFFYTNVLLLSVQVLVPTCLVWFVIYLSQSVFRY